VCHATTSLLNYFPEDFLGAVLVFDDDVFFTVDAPLEDEVPFTGFFAFEDDLGAAFDVVFRGVSFVAAFEAGFFATVEVTFLVDAALPFSSVFICSSSFSAFAVGANFSG
jgi:hypothetical protein